MFLIYAYSNQLNLKQLEIREYRDLVVLKARKYNIFHSRFHCVQLENTTNNWVLWKRLTTEMEVIRKWDS